MKIYGLPFLFLAVPSTALFAQSEHAKQIAQSFVGTPREALASDILVNKPDYVVYIPQENFQVLSDHYNDHFQVIAREDGVLVAFWTQAGHESNTDQHIAFSKSTDHGLTWSPVQVLAGSPNTKNPKLIASWQQPMVSKSGRIYVLWNQQVSNTWSHTGACFGIYSDDCGETWSAPKQVQIPRTFKDPETPAIPTTWCNWQRPLRLGEGGKFFVGSTHRRGQSEGAIDFWQFENIDEDPAVENIKISVFSGEPDQVLKLTPPGKFGEECEEAGIVKLPDGRLFCVMRTDGGYPYWSQSRDAGKTWDRPKPLLNRDGGKPFLHPRSPCPIYDWKGCEAASGYYFALVHNQCDFTMNTAWQNRGPLFLIAGKFMSDAEQPVWFLDPKPFAGRPSNNSFYTSYTVQDGKGVLWFPDHKYFLLGREIGPEWFEGIDELK